MKKIFSAIIAILLATSLQAAIIRTTVNLPFENGTIKVGWIRPPEIDSNAFAPPYYYILYGSFFQVKKSYFEIKK